MGLQSWSILIAHYLHYFQQSHHGKSCGQSLKSWLSGSLSWLATWHCKHAWRIRSTGLNSTSKRNQHDNIIQEPCHCCTKTTQKQLGNKVFKGKLIRCFTSGQDKLLALSPSQAPALIHFWCELLMKESGPDGVSTAKQQKMESKQYSDWWMLVGIVNKNLNLMCNCISIETPICIQPSWWHVGCQAKDPTLDEPELPLANM